jgi:lipopolysaccharide transport system permease protein
MAIEERSALADTRRGTLPVEGSDAADYKPVLEIEGGPGRLSLATLYEFWLYRGVLAAFTVRAVKVRYKQAAVGIGWSVLQPVMAAAIFAVFFGGVTGIALGSENLPYLLFALAGMVAWTYFSTATLRGSEALIENESMLRRLFFPREILPCSAVLAALVDLVPAIAVLAGAVLLYGLSPDLTWLAIPVPVVLLVVFAAALSSMLSAINVYYRDVRHALPFLIQMGLFASPVAYSLATIPEQWRTLYTILNPVAAAIDTLRRTMLHGEWPDWGPTAGALAWSVVLLVVGFAVFKRLERSFADHV